MKKTKRICEKGHTYYKSSDCPTCPTCEELNRASDGFMANLSAPAQRALKGAGIKSLADLSNWTKKELLELHGLGPSSIPKLERELKSKGLDF